jgi:2-iminobutanoate/2-iminopropanoate deaminase
LTAAGATFNDVVKSNIYVMGLNAEIAPTIREVRARYFNKEHPPASTMVGVATLVRAEWPVEVEVVAVVPE